MQISKNATCKTLEELIELIKKLKKRTDIQTFNFSGNCNKKDKTEYFSVNWTEEEEI